MYKLRILYFLGGDKMKKKVHNRKLENFLFRTFIFNKFYTILL